jgi:capsular exopolysaccharide synthesis family protein
VSHIVRYVALPVLGAIPRISGKKAVPYRPGTGVAESYSSLRTALLKITRDRSLKAVMITSANNLEGKSVTAANLAISIAQLKETRLLLADMNLRRPSLHKLFEPNSYANLSELLRRRLGDMFNGLAAENLNIITAGELPEDPAKVLASAEFKYFLKEARAKFDLVLLDSSSVIPYTDSTVLANEADAVLLIIRAGSSRREVVERARHILNVPPEKLIGVVLNSVEYVIPEGLYKRL